MKIQKDKIQFEGYFADGITFENVNHTGAFGTSFKIVPFDFFTEEEVRRMLPILDNLKIKVTIEPVLEMKSIQELKNKRFTKNQKQIAGKINEIIREINKWRDEE